MNRTHAAVLPPTAEAVGLPPITSVEIWVGDDLVAQVTRDQAGEFVAESGGKIGIYRSIEAAIHRALEMARGGK